MKEVIRTRTLHRNVLVIARLMTYEDDNGDTKVHDWAAYITTMPGYDHRIEIENAVIRADGDKLPQKIAEAIFPEFSNFDYPVEYRL